MFMELPAQNYMLTMFHQYPSPASLLCLGILAGSGAICFRAERSDKEAWENSPAHPG